MRYLGMWQEQPNQNPPFNINFMLQTVIQRNTNTLLISLSQHKDKYQNKAQKETPSLNQRPATSVNNVLWTSVASSSLFSFLFPLFLPSSSFSDHLFFYKRMEWNGGRSWEELGLLSLPCSNFANLVVGSLEKRNFPLILISYYMLSYFCGRLSQNRAQYWCKHLLVDAIIIELPLLGYILCFWHGI